MATVPVRSKGNLVVEVTSPTIMVFRSFLDYMPNPDLLLQQTGETIEIYRKMLLDAKIESLLEVRKAQVLKIPMNYLPVDDSPKAQEIADFVKESFDEINYLQDTKEILSAFGFGFSFSEVIWEIWDGGIVLSELKSRKQERISFTSDGVPIIQMMGQRLRLDRPEFKHKFIVHRHDPEAENPYGSSLLKACYWPWKFKNASWRFWLTAAEKFGVPTVIAIFDSDETSDTLRKARAQELAEMLSGIQTDAALAVANVKQIDTLEVKGDLGQFRTLIECCNMEFSYAITGQSLATAEAEFGTRAQATVHHEVLEDISAMDSINLAHTYKTQLVPSIVELWFGAEALPLSPLVVPKLNKLAAWEIVRDAIDRGFPVSKSTLYDEYAIPQPKDEQDSFVKTAQSPVFPFSDNSSFFLPTRTPLRIMSRKKSKPTNSIK